MSDYACDKCGACCRQLIVGVTPDDLNTEPRLKEAAYKIYADGTGADIAIGPSRPCKMLKPDNTCGCYETRPEICSVFEPGSLQCQNSRRAERIPYLQLIQRS